jgi:hypothetical protein
MRSDHYELVLAAAVAEAFARPLLRERVGKRKAPPPASASPLLPSALPSRDRVGHVLGAAGEGEAADPGGVEVAADQAP